MSENQLFRIDNFWRRLIDVAFCVGKSTSSGWWENRSCWWKMLLLLLLLLDLINIATCHCLQCRGIRIDLFAFTSNQWTCSWMRSLMCQWSIRTSIRNIWTVNRWHFIHISVNWVGRLSIVVNWGRLWLTNQRKWLQTSRWWWWSRRRL